MAGSIRVLITGSRTWTHPKSIRDVLDTLLAIHGNLTIVHGYCKDGADAIADRWILDHWSEAYRSSTPRRVEVRRYPAEWAKYGRAGGPIRNAEMVNAGADLCLAFIRNNSDGASKCAQLAQKAGIETRIYRWEERGGTS